jgi:hypothetical protein
VDWKPFESGSMICAVELKYRAPLGRRNIGGSADAGNRMSSTDFLMALLNILLTLNCRGAQLLLPDALSSYVTLKLWFDMNKKNISAWMVSGITAARNLGIRKLLNISRSYSAIPLPEFLTSVLYDPTLRRHISFKMPQNDMDGWRKQHGRRLD